MNQTAHTAPIEGAIGSTISRAFMDAVNHYYDQTHDILDIGDGVNTITRTATKSFVQAVSTTPEGRKLIADTRQRNDLRSTYFFYAFRGSLPYEQAQHIVGYTPIYKQLLDEYFEALTAPLKTNGADTLGRLGLENRQAFDMGNGVRGMAFSDINEAIKYIEEHPEFLDPPDDTPENDNGDAPAP